MFGFLKATLLLVSIMGSIASHNQLKSIDQLILAKKSKKNTKEPLHIQKIDSFHSLQSGSVKAFESIKITTKMKAFANVLVDNSSIYSMNGQLLTSYPANSLISSMRNSYLFLLSQEDDIISISNLVLKNKTVQLQQVAKIKQANSKATSFVVSGIPRLRSSFLVGYSNNSLVKYSQKGVYSGQNDLLDQPLDLIKGSTNIFVIADTQVMIIDAGRPLDTSNCSLITGDRIKKILYKSDEAYIHSSDYVYTFSVSKCQLMKKHSVPANCTVNQLNQFILITKQTISYYLDPSEDSIGIINIKLKEQSVVQTVRKSEYATFIVIHSLESKQVVVYEYIGNSQEPFEVKSFKIPIFIIIIGIIIYYSYKNKTDLKEKKEGEKLVKKIAEEDIDLENMSPEDLKTYEQLVNSQLFKELKEKDRRKGNSKTNQKQD